jgi:glycosyltransferase involved in cell wall biosynthesis
VTTRPRVGLLHYTCPPVIGGVETILYEQAVRLSRRGYPVIVISGRGGPLADGSIQLVINSELDSRHPEVTAVRERLIEAEVPPAFAELRDRMSGWLAEKLADVDVLIVHNALSLHFNLPLTAALWRLADQSRPRIISWVHDISWINPLYRPWMHDGEPWDLLRHQHPKITSIFVSAQRLEEWRLLTGAMLDSSHVIPNGIDPADRFGFWRTDVVMLAPVRITKRKNLEWAIEAAAAVRATGRSVQLLITGPPGPHNPRSLEYVEELRRLTERLGLSEAVRLLFEDAADPEHDYAIDAATLSDLYMLSDVVVLPSASEGFGLPLAEAAVIRVPVVGTELPAFREVAPDGATLVPVAAGSAAFSKAVLEVLDSPPARLRRRVLDSLSWDHIISERIEPLLG